MIFDHSATQQASVPKVHPLDNPSVWGPSDSSCPLSDEQVQAYQRTIDSIAGVTRDNESIVRLVWNGDKRFWREICVEWNSAGEPTEFIQRPIVLFRSVYGPHRKWLHDIPVPRWLLLTRLEPEQYMTTWGRDSKVWMPDRGQYVQVKPETPPRNGWYVWLMTIAEHDKWCCQQATEQHRACFGLYAEPGRGIAELRMMRKGMEEANMPSSDPFDSPDRLTQKLRETSVNDYTEQAMRSYEASVSQFIDSVPYKELREALNEEKDIMLTEHISKERR